MDVQILATTVKKMGVIASIKDGKVVYDHIERQ